MNKIWYVVILIVIVIAGILFFYQRGAENGPAGAPQVTEPVTPPPGTIVGAVVEYTDAGFSPADIQIKKGETVTFLNKSSKEVWPASAVHPTHGVYPEAGGCIGSKFDACKGLVQGESWPFAFNVVGQWQYHNHLNPSDKGSVTVVE